MQHQALDESLGPRSRPAFRGGELYFRRLLEKLPAGAYTCDPSGLITYFNQQAVRLWGRAPKLNDPVDRFCGSFRLFATDGSPIDHDQCWMALALRDEREYNGREIVIERPDGSRVTALAHANPIHDDTGELLGAVNVLVDITDRKRAEEALAAADRRKDEFLATLAHELRNPLAPITSALEILRLKGPPDPELRRAREIIDRQVGQMVHLINDLLDLSRITRDRLELRRERVALAEILAAAVETSRPHLDAGGHELVVEAPAEPVYLDADPTRLPQVISNLLNNAAKFTEGKGRIRLTAERRGSEVAITVGDNGIGIAAELLPHIFDMFTQADRSLERSRGGLGIGLTLARRLVEMHGGSIEATSDGPGRGCEMIVRLPMAREADRRPRPSRREKAPAASPLRILVVDDNRDAADGLSRLLEHRGHRTWTANDGDQALAVAAELAPDVVLLDIGLPGLNGYEVARRLRRHPGGDAILLIAVTGWGQDKDRRRAQEAGFDHHLVKPVDLATLSRLLAARRSAAGEPRRAFPASMRPGAAGA